MKIKPNYKPIRLIFYYSLGFYKDGVIQFYKGGLTDNIPKRLYDLRSYVQKRGYTVDFESDPHIFFGWKSAKKFENKLLAIEDIRTESPFGYFNGHTELFTVAPLEYAYSNGMAESNWDDYWDNFDKECITLLGIWRVGYTSNLYVLTPYICGYAGRMPMRCTMPKT